MTMTPRRYFLLLTFFALIVTVGGLGTREIWSGDESRVAGIAAEMAIAGDWITPKLNTVPFLEYPPLYYYAVAFCFQIFGRTDFAAQLPSALAGLAAGLICFGWCRRLRLDGLSSFIAAAMLLTGAQFFANSRTCMVDSFLALFVLFCFYGFTRMIDMQSRPSGRWIGFGCLWLGLACGVMTKGLVGLALPGAAIGCFCVIDDVLQRRFRPAKYLAALAAALLALLPVGLWCYLLYRHSGYDALHTVVWVNNFGRFTGSQGDHVLPFYYYLAKLPGQFQPYLLLLPFALWYAWKKHDRPALIGLCFLLAPYLLLTVSSSKRQVYLLPLYAPAALLTARFAVDFVRRHPVPAGRILYIGGIVLSGLIGIGGLVAAFLPGTRGAIWPFLAGVLGFAALALVQRHRGRAAMLFSLAFAMLYASIDGAVMARQNDRESLRKLFAYCQANELPVVLCNPPERTKGAAYFYLGRPVAEVQVSAYDGNSTQWWIIRDKRWKEGRAGGDGHRLLRLPLELPRQLREVSKKSDSIMPLNSK